MSGTFKSGLDDLVFLEVELGGYQHRDGGFLAVGGALRGPLINLGTRVKLIPKNIACFHFSESTFLSEALKTREYSQPRRFWDVFGLRTMSPLKIRAMTYSFQAHCHSECVSLTTVDGSSSDTQLPEAGCCLRMDGHKGPLGKGTSEFSLGVWLGGSQSDGRFLSICLDCCRAGESNCKQFSMEAQSL